MSEDRQGVEEISWKLLESVAKEVCLPLVGGFNLDTSDFLKEKTRLKVWQENGFAGEMQYMNRTPNLIADPRQLLPEAQSILSFGLPYDSSPHPELRKGHGRVARYAWGKDYHQIFPSLLMSFLKKLENLTHLKIQFRIFSDAVPLLERACGEKSGIGFVGKNTLLIRPGIGSFFFLGEILLNSKINELPATQKYKGCSTCRNCIANCPTDAFQDEFQLDARKCISYLTIEKRGVLSVEERGMSGEWLFGCDVCQEVCPFNHSAIKSPEISIKEFTQDQGVGALLSILDLLEIKSDLEFRARFKGTPLLRPKRDGLLRNAIHVAVNTLFEDALAPLRVLCQDSSAVLRATALWGVSVLAERKIALPLVENGVHDLSPEVRNEAIRLLEVF